MLSYGAANWFNYGVRIINPEADSLPALILWPLSAVFTGAAVWRFAKDRENKPGPNQNTGWEIPTGVVF